MVCPAAVTFRFDARGKAEVVRENGDEARSVGARGRDVHENSGDTGGRQPGAAGEGERGGASGAEVGQEEPSGCRVRGSAPGA